MDEQKIDALVIANALVFASPSYDKQSVQEKKRNWNQFLDSLDWRAKLSGHKPTKTTKKKQTVGQLFGHIFGGKAQIPVVKDKNKGDESN